MMTLMVEMVHLGIPFNREDGNLLSIAGSRSVGDRRASYRILQSILEKEQRLLQSPIAPLIPQIIPTASAAVDKVQMIKGCIKKVKGELEVACNTMLEC